MPRGAQAAFWTRRLQVQIPVDALFSYLLLLDKRLAEDGMHGMDGLFC